MELFLLVQIMQDRISHRIKNGKYSLQLEVEEKSRRRNDEQIIWILIL